MLKSVIDGFGGFELLKDIKDKIRKSYLRVEEPIYNDIFQTVLDKMMIFVIYLNHECCNEKILDQSCLFPIKKLKPKIKRIRYSNKVNTNEYKKTCTVVLKSLVDGFVRFELLKEIKDQTRKINLRGRRVNLQRHIFNYARQNDVPCNKQKPWGPTM